MEEQEPIEPEGVGLEKDSAFWQTVSASVCGSSHEKSGLPCQDRHCVEALADDVLLIAVADGAGAAAYAEEGATLAVQAAVNCLSFNCERLRSGGDDAEWEAVLRMAVEEAREAVLAAATKRETEARQFASTLIVVIARADVVACTQVGDGGVVVWGSDGQLIALTIPQSGEYLNETTFLTSDDALETLQSLVWRGPVTGLAAFSDGLQMLCLKLPEGIPHAPFFAPLFRFAESGRDANETRAQLENFLRSTKIRQFTDDDLTLVLAIPDLCIR